MRLCQFERRVSAAHSQHKAHPADPNRREAYFAPTNGTGTGTGHFVAAYGCKFRSGRRLALPPFHGQGPGFVSGPSGLVLTNTHVVPEANKVTVKRNDDASSRPSGLAAIFCFQHWCADCHSHEFQTLMSTLEGSHSATPADGRHWPLIVSDMNGKEQAQRWPEGLFGAPSPLAVPRSTASGGSGPRAV